MSAFSSPESPKFYTEHPSQTTWRARFKLAPVDKGSFITTLAQSADALGMRLSGYSVPLAPNTLHHYITNNSRYNLWNPGDYNRAYEQLTRDLRSSGIDFESFARQGAWIDDIAPGRDFRVVFGLRQGYKPEAPVYTLPELAVLLPEDIDKIPADIYSIGGGRETYTEPAVLILGCNSHRLPVYQAARILRQERVYMEMNNGTSFMVEMDTADITSEEQQKAASKPTAAC